MRKMATDEKFDALIGNILYETADCIEAFNSLKEKIDTKIKLTQQAKLSEYAEEIYQ